jgi:hypothetical protein
VTGSDAAQRLLRVHEDLAVQQTHNDLLTVLSTPEGRRFVWGLVAQCGCFVQSFNGDALATAFNEGRRSVGLSLLGLCQAEAPDLCVTAFNEQIAASRAAKTLREAAEAEAKQEAQENETV